MKNKKILFLVAIMIASLWLYGCNNNTDKVNTESQIVENPTETLTETSTEISNWKSVDPDIPSWNHLAFVGISFLYKAAYRAK